jgi:RNA polymerase-binding transcription factor DksA
MARGDMHTTLGNSIGELSIYDNHPADIGTEAFQREEALLRATRMERTLEDVQGAIDRLQTGVYGVCERCGEAIDRGRLEALPETRFCLRCREALEEGVPRVAPGDVSLRAHFIGRDRSSEDWQTLSSYGSSDTLSDVAEEVDAETSGEV